MKFFSSPHATPIDISFLKQDLSSQAELDEAEFENIKRAHDRYFTSRKYQGSHWIQIPILKKIHADMFGEIWEWGGNYRKTRVLPVGVEPHLIPNEIGKLIHDIRYWDQNSPFSLVEQAARIHHRLAWIHPFPNGNGRFSRFISDLYLFAHKCHYPGWPIDLNRSGIEREKYIHSLHQADRGDYELLIEYMIRHGASND